jgi:hypothetical protein
VYDYANNLLPISFENTWNTNAIRRNRPERTLRNDAQLYIPLIRLEHFTKFPLAEFPKIKNEYKAIVSAPTRNTYKSVLKGTVQRKLTGVLSGINLQLMTCHCSDGYSFFNLKGLRSLKSKNVFSALTGTLL